MTIRAIDGKGVHRAQVICDECGREDTVACDYTGKPGRKTEPNEGQIIRKMTGQGWALVRGKLNCPGCEAKRKVDAAAKKQEAEMAEQKSNVRALSGIRLPDRDQKRLIILALEDAYDAKAQRYRGGETDRTVAEGLGATIMPGWVSALREEFFGPAGNEEVEAIRAEIETIRRETAQKLDALTKRLDACVGAHDKRVGA